MLKKKPLKLPSIDIDAIRSVIKEMHEDVEWGDPVGPLTMNHYADTLEKAISEMSETEQIPVDQDAAIERFISTPSYYDKPNETVKKQEAVADILESLTNLSARQIHHIMTHDKYIDRMGEKDPFDHDAYKAANYIHRAITGKWISEVRKRDETKKRKG